MSSVFCAKFNHASGSEAKRSGKFRVYRRLHEFVVNKVCVMGVGVQMVTVLISIWALVLIGHGKGVVNGGFFWSD